MKCLELVDGDLAIGPAGHRTLTGGNRIRQDLQLAMSEPYGDDRFHPDWGSVLHRYLGQVVGIDTEMMVEVEINRILRGYIAVQKNDILNDSATGMRTKFTTNDVIAGVIDIRADIQYDTIYAHVLLVTQSGQQIAISREVAVNA